MAEIPVNRRYQERRRRQREGRPSQDLPIWRPEPLPRARSPRGGIWLLSVLIGVLCAGAMLALARPSTSASIRASASPSLPFPAAASREAEPSPAPSPTPARIWVVAVREGARVRAGPGTQYPRLCALKPGTRVEELARQTMAGGPDWIHVRIPDGACQGPKGQSVQTGWIRGDLLRAPP